MSVKRVVANIAADKIDAARAFYEDVLGMRVAMDLGWIVTFEGAGQAPPQISVAIHGGSGTPVPDVSVEVDDLPSVLEKATEAGYKPEYGPVTEPWGVTRFFIRDPFGRLVNILSHT
jgi:catechol 2,3-dioxygenase-like lactoylglutathione lyase family enzyme